MADDDKKKDTEKKSDRLIQKMYRDYDRYDWSGRQVDRGSDVRRRGTDRDDG